MHLVKDTTNIFEKLGFDSVESNKLNIKSTLMMAIEDYIRCHGLTQERAAELMHVTRPRISDVVRGKIDKFTIDALVDMLAHVGLSVDIKVGH